MIHFAGGRDSYREFFAVQISDGDFYDVCCGWGWIGDGRMRKRSRCENGSSSEHSYGCDCERGWMKLDET
jgi:hypothetical protein